MRSEAGGPSTARSKSCSVGPAVRSVFTRPLPLPRPLPRPRPPVSESALSSAPREGRSLMLSNTAPISGTGRDGGASAGGGGGGGAPAGDAGSGTSAYGFGSPPSAFWERGPRPRRNGRLRSFIRMTTSGALGARSGERGAALRYRSPGGEWQRAVGIRADVREMRRNMNRDVGVDGLSRAVAQKTDATRVARYYGEGAHVAGASDH